MSKILRETNGVKIKSMKKSSKKPKQIELGQINQIMMLCNVIDNLEQKFLEHGLERNLEQLRRHFSKK